MINTLYVKLSHHPIFEVMGLLSVNPAKVVLMVPSDVHLSYDPNQFMTYLKNKCKATFMIQTIDFSDFGLIQSLLTSIQPEDAFLLSNMDTIEDLQLFKNLSNQEKSIYFIESDGDMWHMLGDQVQNVPTKELQLDDFFKSIGGHIIHDEKKFYVHKSYDVILKWIGDHYDHWNNVKSILRNPSLTKTVSESTSISIQNKIENLNDRKSFQAWLDFLHHEGIIQIKRTPIKIIIHFSHHHFKEYFMKFGMWFEHMIYTIIKHNHLLDTLNTGVLFSWDTKQNLVKNELDVVGVSQNRLVIISCKDTTNINEHALNEIALYTDELAESSSIKIIATTMPLTQPHLLARANTPDIHLPHYSGDNQAFIANLKALL